MIFSAPPISNANARLSERLEYPLKQFFSASVRRIACGFIIALALASAVLAAEPLAGTKPLDIEGDLASQMVDGIDRFLLRQIDESVAHRAAFWHRDTFSADKYNESVKPNRQRLAKIVGAVDPRVPFDGLEIVSTTSQQALVATGSGFEALLVRWPVLPGVHGEGLLLRPTRTDPIADVVALPDADQTPEMLAGLGVGDRRSRPRCSSLGGWPRADVGLSCRF